MSTHFEIAQAAVEREWDAMGRMLAMADAGGLRFSRDAVEADFATRVVLALELLADVSRFAPDACACRYCEAGPGAAALFAREWPAQSERIRRASSTRGAEQDRTALGHPLYLALKTAKEAV